MSKEIFFFFLYLEQYVQGYHSGLARKPKSIQKRNYKFKPTASYSTPKINTHKCRKSQFLHIPNLLDKVETLDFLVSEELFLELLK